MFGRQTKYIIEAPNWSLKELFFSVRSRPPGPTLFPGVLFYFLCKTTVERYAFDNVLYVIHQTVIHEPYLTF